MASQFCVKCGSQLSENSKFCTSCGTPVQTDQSAPDPDTNTPAQQPLNDELSPAQPQSPVQETEQTQQKPVQAPAEPVIEPAAGSTYYSTEPKQYSAPTDEHKPAEPEISQPAGPVVPPVRPQQPSPPTPRQPAQPARPQQWQPITPPRYEQQNTNPAAPPANSPYSLMGAWNIALSFILMCVPVIGLAVSIIWALGGCKKIIRRNFARAFLLLLAIGIVLSIITTIIFVVFFADIAKEAFENLIPGYTIDFGLFGK